MLFWLAAIPVSGAERRESQIELTQEEKTFLRDHPVITVHNETDWPPFNFTEDGKPTGFSIDYMNLLASMIGVEVEYVTGPTWNEFLRLMKSGELDVMLNIVKTPDRLTYLHYTSPYIDNPNTILSKTDKPYNGLEELFGKTISVPKGFFYEEILKREFPQIKLHLVKDTLEAMKAVSFGQADAALGELAVFNYLKAKHFMTDLVLSGEVQMGSPEFALLNIASRKDLPLLARILDKAIRSVSEEERRSIQQKWLDDGRTVRKRAPVIELTNAEREWLAAHPEIRLGVDPGYPPFDFIDGDGQHAGMASDYIKLASERLSVVMKPVPNLSWAEVISGVKERKVDVVPAVTRTPERNAFLNFSTVHLNHPSVIITRDDFPFIIGLDDLKGQRVAVVKGYSTTEP